MIVAVRSRARSFRPPRRLSIDRSAYCSHVNVIPNTSHRQNPEIVLYIFETNRDHWQLER